MSRKGKVTADSVISYMKVPPGMVDQWCTEDHLRELSRHVHDWETIIGFLGFESAKVVESKIRTKHPWGLQQQTTEMFLTWREDLGRERATYRKLIAVFVKLQKMGYAEQLCEILLQSPPKPPAPAVVKTERRQEEGGQRERQSEEPGVPAPAVNTQVEGQREAGVQSHVPDTTDQARDPDLLTIDFLLEITDYLYLLTDKADVSNLGLVLGISPDRLKHMEQNSRNFLDDVVTAWLRREGNVDKHGGPRWITLVNALRHRRLRQTGMANTIAKAKGLPVEDNMQ